MTLFTSKAIGRAGLERYADSMRVKYQIPGLTVGLVHLDHDGQTSSESFALGEAKSGRAMASDTVSSIASNTKIITALALGLLIDEGKLTWNSKIRDLLPAWRQQDSLVEKEATIVDLLTHRTGVIKPVFFAPSFTTTEDEVLASYAANPTSDDFRTTMNYHNAQYTVCGMIVKQLSGKDYGTFLQERIFDPLGMTSTTLYGRGIPEDRMAASHSKINGKVYEHDRIYSKAAKMGDQSLYWGAASGLTSSTEDVMRWLAFLIRTSNNLLEPSTLKITQETFKEIITPQIVVDWVFALKMPYLLHTSQPTYSLGQWQTRYQDVAVQYHYGLLPGSSAFTAWLPEQKKAVVVLANESEIGFSIVHLIGIRAIEIMMGLKELDWERQFQVGGILPTTTTQDMTFIEAPVTSNTSPCPIPFSAIAGRYESPFGKPLEIKLSAQHAETSAAEGFLRLSESITKAHLVIVPPPDQAALEQSVLLHHLDDLEFKAMKLLHRYTANETILYTPDEFASRSHSITFQVEHGKVKIFGLQMGRDLKVFRKLA